MECGSGMDGVTSKPIEWTLVYVHMVVFRWRVVSSNDFYVTHMYIAVIVRCFWIHRYPQPHITTTWPLYCIEAHHRSSWSSILRTGGCLFIPNVSDSEGATGGCDGGQVVGRGNADGSIWPEHSHGIHCDHFAFWTLSCDIHLQLHLDTLGVFFWSKLYHKHSHGVHWDRNCIYNTLGVISLAFWTLPWHPFYPQLYLTIVTTIVLIPEHQDVHRQLERYKKSAKEQVDKCARIESECRTGLQELTKVGGRWRWLDAMKVFGGWKGCNESVQNASVIRMNAMSVFRILFEHNETWKVQDAMMDLSMSCDNYKGR